ncbi:hypothetical protein QVD17_13778 [Tagetes erecta]|uniref:Uncharacterized protein n=1 Tax=Tagetes erecta TaxID=13708 RepID=A0AAD8KY83_TARER|nr:hypothetical protein QVD17_13778 [Tagetes erecta]
MHGGVKSRSSDITKPNIKTKFTSQQSTNKCLNTTTHQATFSTFTILIHILIYIFIHQSTNHNSLHFDSFISLTST